MMAGSLIASILLGLVLGGCAQRIYYWGEYEDSLHVRYADPSPAGNEKTVGMLEKTIQQAEQSGQRVPPGVYADYGYILYRRGRLDDAIRYFKREAEVYSESKLLMDSIITRIEAQRATR